MNPVLLSPLTIAVSRREVLRNLGYPRGRQPRPQVAQVVDEVLAQAPACSAAQGIYLWADRHAAEAVGLPRPSHQVALAVCTVGPGPEQQVSRWSETQHPLEAMVWDAWGSAAAEAAADVINARLCAEAQTRGLRLDPRVSPGYGDWDLFGQKALLRWLRAERIGVRLSDTLMMIPRKSVSFAVRAATWAPPEAAHGEVGPRTGHCADCSLTHCAFRDGPAAPGGQAENGVGTAQTNVRKKE